MPASFAAGLADALPGGPLLWLAVWAACGVALIAIVIWSIITSDHGRDDRLGRVDNDLDDRESWERELAAHQRRVRGAR